MSVYQFETNIPEEEFDAFVKKSRYCNLLQSYHWANVKENWDHLYTGIYDENRKLVATGLVLIKHLPAKFTMFYLPRGPIVYLLKWIPELPMPITTMRKKMMSRLIPKPKLSLQS